MQPVQDAVTPGKCDKRQYENLAAFLRLLAQAITKIAGATGSRSLRTYCSIAGDFHTNSFSLIQRRRAVLDGNISERLYSSLAGRLR